MVSFGSHLLFVYTFDLVYFYNCFIKINNYKFMKIYPILVPHFGPCTKKNVIFPFDFAYLNLT